MDQRLVGMSFTDGQRDADGDRAAQRQHRAAGILHAVSGEQQRRALGGEICPAGRFRLGSGADREFDHAEFGNNEWRDVSEHHGHRLHCRSDGELGGTAADRRDGGKQHLDYGDHCGARRRRSERRGHQHRWPERHLDQRLYLYQPGADRCLDHAQFRVHQRRHSVTITGTGFLTGATVKLGGTAASSVMVVNSSSMTATSAAHAAGAVSVVVTNTDSQSGTLTNGYTYTNSAPTVSSITPSSGSISGGTSGTIAGTGFLTGAAVSLAGPRLPMSRW